MIPDQLSVLALILIHVFNMYGSVLATGICAPSDIVKMNRVFCNREPVLLDCLNTQYISEITINYGRTTDAYCGNINHPDDSKVITDCTDQSNARDVIDKKCRFKESCRVEQKDFKSSDCGSGSRYVNVTYSCHEVIGMDNVPRTIVESACENKLLELICLPSTTITVTSATYGRTDPALCFTNDTNTRALTCRAPKSISTVESYCEGQQSCIVNATDFTFHVNSSFCPDVGKYLEVKYFCQPDS